MNWRDKEVLRNFKKNGADYYKNINIWYINWESKRQEAINLGISDIPERVITDDRSLSAKLAQLWVTKTQSYAFWRFDFLKLVMKKGPRKILNHLGVKCD